MDTRKILDKIASSRVLILDGAMGTMIQRFSLNEDDFRGVEFINHTKALKGCNDVLCLTKPDIISSIHREYLKAGADIIETCSFNANSVSLADYSLEKEAYRISRAAAEIARKEADSYCTEEKPRFVAGVIGPTSKTASLSPDVNDPGARGIGWAELVRSYGENAKGLLDGGADVLMVETIFDTLNAKAALFAISDLLDQYGREVPVMISGTIVDAAGRTLSGQTVTAFAISVLHSQPWSVGFNCALGAEKMLPHLKTLSAEVPCYTSAHPNAGLPNALGKYEQSPEEMATQIELFLKDGLVNIVGGCCGSTPEHIAAIAKIAKKYPPREKRRITPRTVFAGLEPLVIEKKRRFTDIGERTNVAGSKKFLRLISEKEFDKAASIAKEMVEAGADLIDICMDDALLPGKESMVRFLNVALSDPEIARVPVMVDSSRWDIIEAGLQCLQGKGLVNSISLKEGEKVFIQRAKLARRYGAAVVVMLFDEKGQADTYERKIEVAGRSYDLLVKSDFPPEDIVFDPNVLSIATGISEHDNYALDFIHACEWISSHCPSVQISGGLSNLSFSFRGNDIVRNAMHSVFLKYATKAGLSMAIVNPSSLVSYDALDPELRRLTEDVVLANSTDAPAFLLEKAVEIKEALDEKRAPGCLQPISGKDDWRKLPVDQRIVIALTKGLDEFIEEDVLEVRKSFQRSIQVIEGPLMKAMNEVGERFGQGKMFLPQVIRSARVMKRAVAVLEPYINAEKEDSELTASEYTINSNKRKKIVMATVKGDVHDIGKNIVSVVLGCNGFDVIDLGVMVSADIILDTAVSEKADMVGLSGLITPSLDEMVFVAGEMERRGLSLPLMVGGATTSEVHTALKIDSVYSGPVVRVADASQAAWVVRSLLSAHERPRFLEVVNEKYSEAIKRHEHIEKEIELISIESARSNQLSIDWETYSTSKPKCTGLIDLGDYDLARIIPYIDWSYFFYTWDMGHGYESVLKDPQKGESAQKLLEDARTLLSRFVLEKRLHACGVVGIFPAQSEKDDVFLYGKNSEIAAKFAFLRNQEKKKTGGANVCLSDLISPRSSNRVDYIGAFALTAGIGLESYVEEFSSIGDDYSAILAKSLTDRLVEAFSEHVHEKVRKDIWAYSPEEKLDLKALHEGKYQGIRPAFGYPSCPDHTDKRKVFELLEAEKRCGMSLTESYMMQPASSVCGLYFANPAAYYFGTGRIGEDQVKDLAVRNAITIEEQNRRLGRK